VQHGKIEKKTLNIIISTQTLIEDEVKNGDKKIRNMNYILKNEVKQNALNVMCTQDIPLIIMQFVPYILLYINWLNTSTYCIGNKC